MESQIQIYNPPRLVSEDEYVFWDQALNRRSDLVHYNWLRATKGAKQLVNPISSSYNETWIESNWMTGNDPALFGKNNDQIYLLARWGTDEAPLRTEEQMMTSYRRRVESEAARDNRIFQGCFFLFEIILTGGGMMILGHNGLVYAGVGFLTIGLLLEIGRRRHKNRGLTRPINVWEQRALAFAQTPR